MSASTVVLGASGLVGSTLTEMLLADHQQTRAVIHSSGNAWRLARLGMDLRQADILQPEQLARAMEGCDVVVNCTRGGPSQLIDGFRNILSAAKSAGVRRFVHISSVAVYGDPPDPRSRDESGPADPKKNTYGWYKLQQDDMVLRAAAAGLPSVVLCPPNIIGAYGYFPAQLLQALSGGLFSYVADGDKPCNTVDVVNLCHAIRLAIDSTISDGRRLFVTDAEETTWRDVIEPLLPLVSHRDVPASLTEQEARALTRSPTEKAASISRSIKHLMSSEMRGVLRKDPLLARMDKLFRRSVARLGSAAEDRLRLTIEGPRSVPTGDAPSYDLSLLSTQLRGVRHSPARATADIGYAPLVSVRDSMDAFVRWTRQMRGMDEPTWDMARELYL